MSTNRRKHRGQNEGSIYWRADESRPGGGLWVGAITLEGRKRKVFYGKTRREVQTKLTVALRMQQQGLPVAPERQTVGAYLDRWLEHSVKPTVRSKTHESYSAYVRLYIKPHLGKKVLSKLTPQDLREFLNKMRAGGKLGRRIGGKDNVGAGEPLSPRVVQYLHAIMRRALKQAERDGLVARNVALLVDPPTVRRQEVIPLTPDQARTFLASVEGHRLEAFFTVAIALGLRPGEALGLRWEDVDLKGKSLRVTQAIQRTGGKLQVVDLKTERSRRSIALPSQAVAALRAHRLRQNEERMLFRHRWKESGLVFTTTTGTAIDPANASARFRELLKVAGLPPVRLYDLRHTCASLLVAQGVHPRAIMEILGHSQIALTMNTYSHIFPELQRDAADKMEAILDPDAG